MLRRGSSRISEENFNGRLQREKAKTGAVSVSLAWNDPSDLDLEASVYLSLPTGGMAKIYYGNKQAAGGYLDVDMHARDGEESNEPVENIFWKKPPAGVYVIYVNLYKKRGTRGAAIPFRALLRREGEDDLSREGEVEMEPSTSRRVEVFRFTVDRDGEVSMNRVGGPQPGIYPGPMNTGGGGFGSGFGGRAPMRRSRAPRAMKAKVMKVMKVMKAARKLAEKSRWKVVTPNSMWIRAEPSRSAATVKVAKPGYTVWGFDRGDGWVELVPPSENGFMLIRSHRSGHHELLRKEEVSKIAKGKKAKVAVWRGKKVKTSGGLKKDDLVKNKKKKIVSKSRQKQGQDSKWARACAKARALKGYTGFKAVKRGGSFYEKAKELMKDM